MRFIGIRLCEHDSNITYTNGSKVKYYKSERDYQIKHHGFDDLSQWKKIIDRWEINPKQIDAIGIVLDCFRHPYIKCDESKLYEVIDIPLFKSMGFECPVFRIDHHYSHFLSCWTLGVNPTKSFVFDGWGDDWISHSCFDGERRILKYHRQEYPSLGGLLGHLGQIIGLSGSSHDLAGKVMALKGYGNRFLIDDENFSEKYSLKNLDSLWDLDYVKSIKNDQKRLYSHIRFCHEQSERIYADHFVNHSSRDDIICYSGGVAQNTIINSEIKKVRPNLVIPPHCNDEGLSLGIVEFLRKYYDQESFDNSGYPYWQSDEKPKTVVTEKTIKKTAEFLAQGKIIGWYQGNGEVGPRALGNRSILMNPSIKDGKDTINKKVKHRESFRPFGASILEEKTSDYFHWNDVSPHMLYVMDVIDCQSFPAITHVDGTCRIQTVSPNISTYYSLIQEFENLTGIPMLLNTSLNNGGKPICGSPNEALELFNSSDLDVLVIGDIIHQK
jgi:carbamoyltransferase